jgi:hypothetical protein
MSGKKRLLVANSLSNSSVQKSNRGRVQQHMKNKILIALSVTSALFALSIAASAQAPCKEDGSIRSVTKARSGNFETVTFEIVGSTLPQIVEVRNEKPPITNYGGDNLHMKGPYFKSVNLRMVPWTCDIRENFRVRTSTITGVKQEEQFEGYVGYAIGYTSKRKYVGVTKTIGAKTSKVVVKFRR